MAWGVIGQTRWVWYIYEECINYLYRSWNERYLVINSPKTLRKRLRPFGLGLGLTKENVKTIQTEKERKAQANEAKRTRNSFFFLEIWRKERDDQHVTGVAAQQEEKDRRESEKAFKKGGYRFSWPSDSYSQFFHEVLSPTVIDNFSDAEMEC